MTLLSTETRVKWAFAVFLALVAGYLDGYGLRVLGTYVSFMSGNTTFTGLKSGQGNFQAALPSAMAVLSFVTGKQGGKDDGQSLPSNTTKGAAVRVAEVKDHRPVPRHRAIRE